MRRHAFAQRRIASVRGITVPAGQVSRLIAAERQGQLHRLDHRGHQHAPLGCGRRLVLDPLRRHRVWRPQHHHATGGVERLFDGRVEGLAGDDSAVPPDRPARRLERRRQRGGALAVSAGVAEEDVGHG